MARPSLIIASLFGLSLMGTASAQDQQAPDASEQGSPVQTLPAEGEQSSTDQAQGQADQCRENLNAFVTQLNEEQYWVTGWGNMPGYGFGGAMADPAAPADTTAAPVDPAQTTMGVPELAGAHGYQSPRRQIQVLYSAAHVFAEQNNQDGCDYVLGQLASTYERYRDALTEAGVEPAAVADWRQEQLALAERVGETDISRFTIENIIGSDVRTRSDEYLGSVNDVIINPGTGDVGYLIVARGGFLGIGEELVAVPWQAFATAPGLNTLVLDLEQDHLQNAPAIDSGFWDDQQNYQALIEQTEEYWNIDSSQ